MKNTSLLRCTANQVGTGHKLHFHNKHPVRTKLAAINNKNGCGTAEVRCRHFGSVSYHWYYHIRSGKRVIFFPCLFEYTIHHMIDCCFLVCLLFIPGDPLQSPNLSPAVRPCLHVLQFLWRFFSQIPAKVNSTYPRALLTSPPPPSQLRLVASRRPIES